MNIIKRKNNNEENKNISGGRTLSLREAMNQLFDESFWTPNDFFSDISLQEPINSNFPKADITEDDKEIKVAIDIPGIDPEKVDIEVEDDNLYVNGKIEREEEDSKKRYYKYERSYGEFNRCFSLPSKIDPEKVSANAKNGVLTIILPKTKEENRKKVKVLNS